jgi:hypothetical protein
MTLTARTATLAAVLAATTLLTTTPAHAQAIDLSSLPVVGSLLGGGGDAAEKAADAVEDAVDDAT